MPVCEKDAKGRTRLCEEALADNSALFGLAVVATQVALVQRGLLDKVTPDKEEEITEAQLDYRQRLAQRCRVHLRLMVPPAAERADAIAASGRKDIAGMTTTAAICLAGAAAVLDVFPEEIPCGWGDLEPGVN